MFDRDASQEVCGYEEYLEGTEDLDHYQILDRAPDGRHFTWLWSSQDSSYGGVIGGEWLSEADADSFLEDCRARGQGG